MLSQLRAGLVIFLLLTLVIGVAYPFVVLLIAQGIFPHRANGSLVERDGKLLISADLPGVKKEDVKVEINQDLVTIQGQRHEERTSSDRGYYQSERSYGSFYRSIPLPEGANTESASATFRDGVLQIEVQAPSQQARGRTLEIKDAGTTGGSKNGGQQQQR